MRSKPDPVNQPERTAHYDCAVCIAEMLHNTFMQRMFGMKLMPINFCMASHVRQNVNYYNTTNCQRVLFCTKEFIIKLYFHRKRRGVFSFFSFIKMTLSKWLHEVLN